MRVENLARPDRGASVRGAVALELARQHLRDPDLSVGFLAARLGMTRAHLSTLLGAALGLRFDLWVRKRRVELARHVLIESPCLPVKQVAAQCGFRSTGALDRAFVVEEGLAPSRYREAVVLEAMQSVNESNDMRSDRTAPEPSCRYPLVSAKLLAP